MKKIFYKTAILLIVAITSIIPAGINSHAKTDSGLEKACSAAVKAAGNAEKDTTEHQTAGNFGTMLLYGCFRLHFVLSNRV